MGRFGDTLKIAIKISGLKYANIAQKINFDPSYISKWIHTDLLPSSKVIIFICEELSKLFIEHLDEKSLNNFCEELEITYSADTLSLSHAIYTKIYEDYLLDSNEKNLKEKSIIELHNNSSSQTISKDRDIILDKIAHYRKISNSITISIVGDLLFCSPDDIIFFMDIKSEIINQDFKNVNFKVFTSDTIFSNYSNEFTGIALINLFMIDCNFNVSYYSIKSISSGIIINIDNLLSYTAQLSYNNTWLLTNCTYQFEQINNFSKVIEKDILPIARNLFETYSESSPDYIESMVKIFSLRQNSVIIGTLDTFFSTTELLEYIFSISDFLSCDLKAYWLKKHKINEKRIDNGEEIRYIIYRDAFDKLVYKGYIRLFEKEIFLPIELRLKLLECINEKLERLPNIKIKVVDSYLVDEIKHNPLPNVYISNTNAYFLTSPVDNTFKYCYLNNRKYVTYLNEVFSSLWNESNISLLDGNIVVEDYLNICQEILFFELV